jgi:aryl-alcohol dehydrogenase-like predicted oxidoreductase
MTLIDTADAYGPLTNEELVGRALTGGHRERAVLATKVGLVLSDSGPASGFGTTSPVPSAGPSTGGGGAVRAVAVDPRRAGRGAAVLRGGIALLPFAPLERGFLAGEPVGRRVDVVGEDRDVPGRASWCSRA